MARHLDGSVSKATPNTVAAMKRSAEKRRCPQCGRGSALKHYSDDTFFGSYCRWDDCGWRRLTERRPITHPNEEPG